MNRSLALVVTMLAAAGTSVSAFVDDFSVAHDYKTDGITGTGWEGLFGGGLQPGELIVRSAAGELTLQSNGGWWNDPYDDGGGAYGPFLYRNVTGDFVAITRVTAFAGTLDAQNFHNNAGIMARTPGGEATSLENTVQVAYFPTWTGHIAWNTIDNSREEIGFTVPIWTGDSYAAAARYPFLQLERSGDDFHFRISADGVNWIPLTQENVLYDGTQTPVIRTRSDMPDTLQVGLVQANAEMNTGFASFDFFAAGKILALTSGSPIVKEQSQTSAEFTVRLIENNGPPDADVNVRVVPYALPDLTADPNTNDPNDILLGGAAGPGYPISLRFPVSAWNTPKAVTVSAIDDLFKEGPEQIGLRLEVYSSDPDYDGQLGQGVLVSVVDDDASGLSVGQTDGSTVVGEGGGADGFSIALAIAPLGDVEVTLLPTPGQIQVQPQALTFTAADWETPQTVSVTAIDDLAVENDPHFAAIEFALTSADPAYSGLDVPDLRVTILENDCGAWGFLPMDRTLDCVVDLRDLAEFARVWLACTMPNDLACDDLRQP